MRSMFFFARLLLSVLFIVLPKASVSAEVVVTSKAGTSFSSEDYRAIIKSLEGRILSPEHAMQMILRKEATAEEMAATCYVIHKLSRGEKAKEYSLALSAATEKSSELWKAYPGNLDILSLKLRFSLYPELHCSPYFEIAHHIVSVLEDRTDLDTVESEIVNSYFLWILSMYSNYFLQRAQSGFLQGLKSKEYVTGIFPRTYSVFSPESDVPTDMDLAMWRALILHHASSTQIHKERWKKRALSVAEDGKDLSVVMTTEEAKKRMAILVASSVVREYCFRKSEVDEGLLVASAVKAHLAQKERQEHFEKYGYASIKDIEKRTQLERLVRLPSNDWEAHRALVHFYMSTQCRNKEHPLSSDFGGPAPVFSLAKAYFLLMVRKDDKDAVIQAKELTTSVLKEHAEHVIGLAILAMCHHCSGLDKDASDALARVKKQSKKFLEINSPSELFEPERIWVNSSPKGDSDKF